MDSCLIKLGSADCHVYLCPMILEDVITKSVLSSYKVGTVNRYQQA